MYALTELLEMGRKANGRAKKRTVGLHEARQMLELLEFHEAKPQTKTIRVYSREGFVANSYNYKAEIVAFEAYRDESGRFRVTAAKFDAKRSHGQGAQITVNSRPVKESE